MNTTLKINEMKKLYKIKKDTDFANFLGISQSTLANWKARDSMDYDLVISKCDKINGNWLITGEGDMLLQSGEPPNDIDTSFWTLGNYYYPSVNASAGLDFLTDNSHFDDRARILLPKT